MTKVLENILRSLLINEEENVDGLNSWVANLKERNNKLVLIMFFKNWMRKMRKILLLHIFLQGLKRLDMFLSQTKQWKWSILLPLIFIVSKYVKIGPKSLLLTDFATKRWLKIALYIFSKNTTIAIGFIVVIVFLNVEVVTSFTSRIIPIRQKIMKYYKSKRLKIF